MNWSTCTKAAPLLAPLLLLFSSCNRVQQQPADSSSANEVFSSTPPYKTIEPDRYQAFRVITVTTTAGTSQVSRTLIVKDGSLRREEVVEPAGLVYLYLPQGIFILDPKSRIYSEVKPSGESTPATPSLDDSPEPKLHEGGAERVYRQLGQEDVNGRRLRKYQIVVNGTAPTNVPSLETFVWVDEELGMPIKTQIKSGEASNTVIELREIKREVDRNLLQIPENYRKVTSAEIQEALRRK